ncbi:MAG: glycoside hydrolase family 16 protein [Bacteroidota bacterium]
MFSIKNSYLFFLALGFITCSKKSANTNNNPPIPTPPTPPSWNFETTPVWADEFTTDGAPDAAKWTFETGGNGWGNNELEYYTNGTNAIVQNGALNITAKKESFGGRNYTSSRMITKNKGDWKYGRFEIKAKIPKGVGTWPAIWLLATDNVYGGWPNSGEIDIMEHVGFDPYKIHFTVHNKTYNGGNGRGAERVISTAFDAFHVYRCDWGPGGIRGFIDGEQYFEYPNTYFSSDQWPYDQKFFMILNIAVGGNWGGLQGVDDTSFPASMEIDYVRVYKWIP